MNLGKKLTVGEIVDDPGSEEQPPVPDRVAEVVMNDEQERFEALRRG